MARCRFCNKAVPQGIARCPYCYASLQAPPPTKSEVVSPFEARVGLTKKEQGRPFSRPKRTGRPRASHLIMFGCLSLILLIMVGAVSVVQLAPHLVRAVLVGPPTPLPPTPRPTLTPSPVPSPTPEWNVFLGVDDSFSVAFPPHWVVINFADPNWEKVFRFESLRYSWLERQLPENRCLEATETGLMVAFDPRRLGNSSVHCRSKPELAGMTAGEMRDQLSETLPEIATTLGGRVQGGVRADLTEVGGQPAAMFEVVVLPGQEANVEQPLKLQLFTLAGEHRGYWIEVIGIGHELDEDASLVRKVLDSFQITGQQGVK